MSLSAFIVLRLIFLAYNLGWLIYNIYLFGGKLFIFLTNWTFTILVIYFIVATTLSSIALYNDLKNTRVSTNRETPVVAIEMGSGDEGEASNENAREQDALRWEHKLLWFLHIIAASAGLWITVGYWTVLIEDDVIDANNITKHALNSVFMVIDTAVSSIPMRFLHWLYALLYIAVYLLFSVIYWQLGGTNNRGRPYIYKALDYNDFQLRTGGLLVGFMFVVLPLLHLFLLGITKLRDYLHKKCYDRSI